MFTMCKHSFPSVQRRLGGIGFDNIFACTCVNKVFSQCSESTGWNTKKISGTNVKCKFTFEYSEAGVSSSSV